MVGRRGEAPLVPPYNFRRPNKAITLRERSLVSASGFVRSGRGVLRSARFITRRQTKRAPSTTLETYISMVTRTAPRASSSRVVTETPRNARSVSICVRAWLVSGSVRNEQRAGATSSRDCQTLIPSGSNN